MFTFNDLAPYKVVPVIAIDDVAHALPLADALIAGGLPVAEITFRSSVAAEVIRIMTRERPEMIVGAGTVLSPETVEQAKACGARFGVAPGLNPRVVKHAQDAGFPFIPGISSATDIEAALELGCKLLKFFPAEVAGGVKMVSALSAPYQQTGVKFMPTGGLTLEKLEEYFKIKTVMVCGGTWIAKKEDMVAGRWDLITANCKAVLACLNLKR
jgi:2-dehydro-3-deoxyphosphogluconate aldolase/(4S)-4-hydroxy-2-oxoglutarate aldolase